MKKLTILMMLSMLMACGGKKEAAPEEIPNEVETVEEAPADTVALEEDSEGGNDTDDKTDSTENEDGVI